MEKSRFYFHSFFISLIPILYIAGHNLAEAPGKEILQAAVIVLSMTAGMLAILRILLKKWEICTFICSLFLILFFSYGPLFDLSYSSHFPLLAYSLGLTGLLILLFASIVLFIVKNTKTITLANRFLNIFSFIMLCMVGLTTITQPVFWAKVKKIPSIAQTIFKRSTPVTVTPLTTPLPLTLTLTGKHTTTYPDIYYIILDAYARGDVLKQFFQYDNSDFENALRAKGFYLAAQSTSNYPMTHLSLASSLSMEHINELAAEHGSKNCEPYLALIRTPKIAQQLKNKGYKYITISSGWGPTGQASPYSDYHFTTKMSTLSNYQRTLLAMTPLKSWIGRSEANLRLYALDKIKNLHQETSHPCFVFMHLLMPHPPAYFDSKGNIINTTQTSHHHYYDKSEYIEQLKFLNQKMLEAVNSIVENSQTPPIILIQGDHGSGITLEHFKKGAPTSIQIQERFPILNAYYGPKEFLKTLYPTITPVNSFRLVLNHLQSEQLTLLPDKNYFQWHYDDAGIQEVTAKVKQLTVRSADNS